MGALHAAIEVAMHRVHWALHWGRFHAGSATLGADSGVQLMVRLAMLVLLARFGFAIGTYAQAKREGRAHEEDEASAD